ncbi:MAG: hypothetical protein ACFE95_09830 [Candidatus Hodarchaeota archaeon]
MKLTCQRIEEYGDFSYVGEAINAIVNAFHSCRIDLQGRELIMKIFGVELNWQAIKDILWGFGNKPSSWEAPKNPKNGVVSIEGNEEPECEDNNYSKKD